MTALRTHLIGIVGPKRAGKDTFARVIMARHGGQAVSFAAPIRTMIRSGFNIPEDSPYWEEKKEEVIPWLGVSMRKLMQTLGTEWGRKLVHPDLWTKLLERRMVPNISPVIVTDVRFLNEQKWVMSRGGILIGVNRFDKDEDGHISEQVDYGLCAHVVQNKTTLEEYKAKCEEVITHVLETRKPVHSPST